MVHRLALPVSCRPSSIWIPATWIAPVIFSLWGPRSTIAFSGGHLPYEGRNIAEIVVAMRKGEVRPLREYNPDVPPNFEELLMATLNNNPKKRPFCWAKLLASIDRVYKGGKMVK